MYKVVIKWKKILGLFYWKKHIKTGFETFNEAQQYAIDFVDTKLGRGEDCVYVEIYECIPYEGGK